MKPGGVVTVERRSGSGRRRCGSSSTVNGLWAPAVLSGRGRRSKLGREGPRRRRGTGAAVGPGSMVKNCGRVLVRAGRRPRARSSLSTGVGAALGRRRQQAALGAEEVQVELRSAGSAAGSSKVVDELAGLRVGLDRCRRA